MVRVTKSLAQDVANNWQSQIFADDVQEEKGENARLSMCLGRLESGRDSDHVQALSWEQSPWATW